MTLEATCRRLIGRGEIPGSNGGIYNPGALLDGGAIVLLCRREIDYRFTPFVFPEVVTIDPDSLAVLGHRTLRKQGRLFDARVEDFRCIDFRGSRLVAHTLVGAGAIKPAIARMTDTALEPFDPFDLPIPLARVEKNWVLFEHEGMLHCLYQLDPLTIFARDADGVWRLVKEEENGWAVEHGGRLSNSTNLIPFDSGYLGFWHTVVNGVYAQGAFGLGRDLSITAKTGVLLDGRRVCDSHKPGVLYVSSLLEHGGRVLAFYGEGDAHTGVAMFDREALAQELRQSPFRPRPSLRICYEGTTLSDVFRAAQTLQAFSAERGHPGIRLYVPEGTPPSAGHLLQAPNVLVGPLRDGQSYEGRLSGRTGQLVWASASCPDAEV